MVINRNGILYYVYDSINSWENYIICDGIWWSADKGWPIYEKFL